MSLWGYFTSCLDRYADFHGRARRREYGGFLFFLSMFGIVIFGMAQIMPLFYVLLFLGGMVSFIPFLAVTWRRFHDVNISGAAALPACLALLFSGVLLPLMCVICLFVEDWNKQDLHPIDMPLDLFAEVLFVMFTQMLIKISLLGDDYGHITACAILFIAGLVYWMAVVTKDSTPGENRFGPNPKGL